MAKLQYEADGPLRNVHISVGVFTTMGEGSAYLSNDLVGDWFEEVPPRGRLVCELPKVPFLPGTYTVSVYCTVSGVLADWVQEAARIDVAEGDFFGSGKLPPASYGSIAVDHRWHVEDLGA